jgi:hypothetical protein
MLSLFEGSYAVIHKARGPAPHDNVAVFEMQPAHRVGAALASPQEHGRNSQRDGDNRSPRIFFIAILMKAKLGARDIAVDQASVCILAGEAGGGSGFQRQFKK